MWASAIGVTRLVAPGPDGRHADADPAGRGGVALRGVARALLVAHQDVADRGVDQRVVRREDRAAGDAEDVGAPAASSERIRLCAPVICSVIVCLFLVLRPARTHGSTKNPPGRLARGATRRRGRSTRRVSTRSVHAWATVTQPSQDAVRESHSSAGGGLAPVGGADADLVAVRVGEHPERRRLVVADQRAAGASAACEPLLGGVAAAPRCRGGSAAAARRWPRAPPGTTACCCGRRCRRPPSRSRCS